MSERLKKRVKVFDAARYDGDDWPGDKLKDMIAWLCNKYFLIPEECRIEATFEIICLENVSFEIYYERPETDDEMIARVMHQEKDRLATEQREKQMLQFLMEKYGVLEKTS